MAGSSSSPHICDVLEVGLQRRGAECTSQGDSEPWVLQCAGRRLTGRHVAGRVCALAAGLMSQGNNAGAAEVALEAGERVILLALNTDHFLEALLAASATGAVVAPVNHRWSVAEAVASTRPLSPVALLLDPACSTLGAALAAGLTTLRAVIWLGDSDPAPSSRFLRAEALISTHSDACDRGRPVLRARHAPDGSALICFTSGTSGRSKAAVLSHDALLGQAFAKVYLAAYSPHDTYLHAAPLFHIGGLSYALALLAAGARHALLPRFTADSAHSALRQGHVTATIMVPAILNQLVASHATATFPSVRSIVIGAGRPSAAQLRACKAMFPRAAFHTAYGMTEAASTITWRTLWRAGEDVRVLEPHAEGAHPSALGCVGHPVPNTELLIMASTERQAGVGEEGEVWVRGAHIMRGYYGMADETAAVLSADGWFVTGDIGCTDRSGRMWLMGRKKDTIKTGGENVHAEEVEAWLASHPGVAAAAVVGLPDEALGERVSVLVQLRGGWIWNEASSEEEHGQRKFGLSELQQHCVRVGMSRYKIPRVGLGTREPLPVNAAGKVLKHDVRVRLLAHFTPHQDSKL